MKTIKSGKRHFGIMLGIALPLSLLLAGCNKNNETTSNENTTNTTMTGATAQATQGTSQADESMTTKIQQAIDSPQSSYSAVAKDVKVVTDNGKVTLSGTVDTAQQKSGIVMLAQNIAGQKNVTDDLTVKTTP